MFQDHCLRMENQWSLSLLSLLSLLSQPESNITAIVSFYLFTITKNYLPSPRIHQFIKENQSYVIKKLSLIWNNNILARLLIQYVWDIRKSRIDLLVYVVPKTLLYTGTYIDTSILDNRYFCIYNVTYFPLQMIRRLPLPINCTTSCECLEGRKEMFYLMTLNTFIYGYMASDVWLRTILIMRKETCCRHIGYSFQLTAWVLLYPPSHR